MALTPEEERRLRELEQELGFTADEFFGNRPSASQPAPAPGSPQGMTDDRYQEAVAQLFANRVPQAAPAQDGPQEVTTGRALKHALTGFPSGVGDTLNLPNTLSRMANTVAPYSPVGLAYGMATGQDLSFPEIPKSTEGLSMLPGGQAVSEFVQPELTEEEIESSNLGRIAQGGRTAFEWFQPSSWVARGENVLTSDPVQEAAMALAAAGGERLGRMFGDAEGDLSEAGFGGLAAVLQMLRGRAPSGSPEDEAARQIIRENMTGENVDEILDATQARIDAGEAGTTGDLTRNTGVMRIEESLATGDQSYADNLAELGRLRDRQIRDEVTVPFRRSQDGDVVPMRPVIDPETGSPTPNTSLEAARRDVESRRQAIEEATAAQVQDVRAQAAAEQQQTAEALTAAESRPLPDPAPAEQRAAEARATAEELAAQRAQAQAARGEAEAGYAPVRVEQISAQVPTSVREDVFKDIPEDDLAARQQAANRYWESEAFSEVKQSDKTFSVPKESMEGIRRYLNQPEVRVDFEGYMNNVVEAARRTQGIDPSIRAKYTTEDGGFNFEKYMEDILGGEMTGRQMMALRNYFAGDKTGNYIKWELDDVIASTLDPADAVKYREQMEIYPTHLTQKAVADQNAVFMERGAYSPEQRVAAGKQYGRPGSETDVAAREQINAAQERLDRAVAAEKEAVRAAKGADSEAVRAAQAEVRAAKQQQTEVNKLNRAMTQQQKAEETAVGAIEREGAKRQAGLDATVEAQYAKSGPKTIRKLLTTPEQSDQLGALYRSMTDLGERETFRQEVAREMIESITDSAGRVLPRSASKFESMHKNLYDSGLMTGEDALEIQTAIDKTVTDTLRRDVRGRIQKPSQSEINELGSAAVAALAVNLAPGASTSLIMGGTIKKIINKHLRNMADNPEDILASVRAITSDPQAFVDAMRTAETEAQAAKMFLQQWVALGQIDAELAEEDL